MAYFWLPIGLLLPTIIGWSVLRILEGKTPVLFTGERIVAGLCIGVVGTMFDTFLLHVIGLVPLSFVGMLLVQVLSALLLGGIVYTLKLHQIKSPTVSHQPLRQWQKILTALFGVWLVAKLIAGFIFLIGPPYYDDTMNNWNLRGKAFFVQEEILLEIEPGKGTGVASYPQSVPMIKAWLAHLNGEWHEGLVNSIHVVWYACALLLIFYALRRALSLPWAIIGTYVLSSIPLFTMHGIIPYADLYLSVLLFLAVSWLYFGVKESENRRMSFIRMSSLVTGILIFTKNEALLLHLPPILLLVVLSIIFAKFSQKEMKSTALWYGIMTLACLIPWLSYKWYHGLAFGNAKSVSGLSIEWHEGVLQAIAKNTLFEGNWSLLPVIFVGLCIAKWRKVVLSPLGIICGFVFAVWLGQLPIYTLTELYIEALNQTGYARGLIHLVPLVVFAVTILTHSILHRKTEEISV